jgi:hypothetical protein
VYEYACHEGNYAMTDILGGARKMEAEPPKKYAKTDGTRTDALRFRRDGYLGSMDSSNLLLGVW